MLKTVGYKQNRIPLHRQDHQEIEVRRVPRPVAQAGEVTQILASGQKQRVQTTLPEHLLRAGVSRRVLLGRKIWIAELFHPFNPHSSATLRVSRARSSGDSPRRPTIASKVHNRV